MKKIESRKLSSFHICDTSPQRGGGAGNPPLVFPPYSEDPGGGGELLYQQELEPNLRNDYF